MGNSASRSATLTSAQSLGVSGVLSPSTQSGRDSQNVTAVISAFARAFQNGVITRFELPQVVAAIEGLLASLDKDGSEAVDLTFISELPDWRAEHGNEGLFPDIQLAVWAAAKVYSLTTPEEFEQYRRESSERPQPELLEAQPAELVDGSEASYLSNTKNWALFRDRQSGNLVFSVRGTSTKGIALVIDNLTNLDATEMLNMEQEGQPPWYSHRGFLEVAQAMFPDVAQAIGAVPFDDGNKVNLIFSGHSAGGGTALLLYHLFQTTAPDLAQRFNAVHCFTIGSAAVATIPNPVHAGRKSDRIVSFINLRDPVPRADLPYAMWLAQCLGQFLTREAGGPVTAYPELPTQKLYPGGQLVLLDEGAEVVGKLEPDRLSSVAFADLEAHGKYEYLRIIQNLLV